MRDGTVVVVDGAVVNAGDPALSALDMGFLHGDSLFTTMAVSSGLPVFWEDHLSRLAKSARFFGYPPLPGGGVLLSDCVLAIGAGPTPPTALRMTLSRGRATVPGIDGVSESVVRVVVPLSRPPRTLAAFREGVAAELFRLPWDPAGDIRFSHKTGNLLWVKWIRQQKISPSSFEQILVNGRGEILEGTVSSVFGVDRDGVLRTAPLESGILPGVVRGRILAWARREGIPVREEALRLSEISSLRELFLSSATLPVLPVRSLSAFGEELSFLGEAATAGLFLGRYPEELPSPS